MKNLNFIYSFIPNVFVTERLECQCFVKRCSSSCRGKSCLIFSACVSHSCVLSKRPAVCLKFSAIFSWHLPFIARIMVFVVMRLRCIMMHDRLSKTWSPHHWTRNPLAARDFVLSCYVGPDIWWTIYIRLSLGFLVRFYSVVSAVWESETVTQRDGGGWTW